MNLGVQYYRPPFPVKKYWINDFKQIRDSGLNTVQLWLLWGWIEAKPGTLVYDDYDELIELAQKNGLNVVLSTIAEIQPCWIHREIPGSEMITSMGHKVVSSNRSECHFGITPGGCTDHPGVWKRMSHFLTETVKRYRAAPNLAGWDAWNELRWNVNADGLVCYCEHTLKAFRGWLDEKYGGLDGLNKAWLRRYGSWDEVLPGKTFNRPYTEMTAFEHFTTIRANRHAEARYRVMKPLDPKHPVTVHAGSPSPITDGGCENSPIDRGNDWAFADILDGVGCSSFPKWMGMDDAAFGMRVEFVKSAAQGKRVWLSEVQGGRSAIGFNVYQRVDALSQQRWIWNGLACGADTILFWCWRDEVFGCESGGFGIIGRDGLAEERITALKTTGRLIHEHKELIDSYQPVKPEVGILFSPRSYYLYWAQEGNAWRSIGAIQAYARSLIRRSIPYTVVEEDHLDALTGLKILFLPRVIVTSPELEKSLTRFVENGGTILCESECGAFSPEGIYRYPEERWLAKLTGVVEVGRRNIAGALDVEENMQRDMVETFNVEFCGHRLCLDGVQWITPMTIDKGKTLAQHSDGALIADTPVGKGRVILVGTYLGKTLNADLEEFLELSTRQAGWEPAIEILAPKPTTESFLYIKYGLSGGRRMVFIFFPADQDSAQLRFCHGFFKSEKLRDLISGESVAAVAGKSGYEITIAAKGLRIAVLVEE